MTCNKCKLFKTCKNPCIQGVGPIPANIMLIGTAPGADEDKQGLPFVGAAGKRLNIILKEAGLDRNSLRVDNTVRCRPIDNRDPEPEEIKACFPYLEEEIQKVKPKIIVPLGGIALQTIQGLEGIASWAGTKHWNEKYNCWVMPTFHPAYICRRLGLQGVMIDHLKNVVEWLKNPIEPDPPKYVIIDTIEKAQKFFDRLSKVDIFAFDIETSGLDFWKDKILCCSFSWKERTGVVLLILQQHCKEFWKPEEKEWIIEQLKKVLESNIGKIGQNLSFDIQFLKSSGIKLNNFTFDTMLAHHLLDENVGREGHGLDTMVLRYFPDMGKYDEELSKYLPNKNTSYAVIPNEVLWKYSAMDADATFRCYQKFKPELEKQGLMRLFNKITIPFQKVLLETEYHGVKLDIDRLKELKVEYEERLKKIEEEFKSTDAVRKVEKALYDRSAKKIEKRYDSLKSKRLSKEEYIKKYTKPTSFNLRSSIHLQILLFEVLGFESVKETKKGGISTDKEVLDSLADKSPELIKLKEHRDLSKLLNTYVIGMLERVDENGRIHTDYHMDGTVTGRLSSSNPNLQNIPRDSAIKECFIVEPGCELLEADFSQAEYKCWAHYANDLKMIKAINSGVDVHKQMASICFNKKIEEVTLKERQQAKNCVSGNTLIPTKGGWKYIKNLQKGDKVLDHCGQEQTILKTISYEDVLYKVNTFSGLFLDCTDNHPFIVFRNGKFLDIPLKNLRKDDNLLLCGNTLQLPKKGGSIEWIPPNNLKVTNYKPLYNKWKIDSDLSYLIGFFLAEGTFRRKWKTLDFAGIEYTQYRYSKLIPIIDSLLKKYFFDRVKRSINTEGNIHWDINSREIAEFFKFLGIVKFNKKKGQKSFPWILVKSPINIRKSLLKGLFDGDGCFHGIKSNYVKYISYTTVSKDIAQGVCFLLFSLGINCYVKKIAPKDLKKHQPVYEIFIYTFQDLKRFLKKVGSNDSKRLKILKTSVNRRGSMKLIYNRDLRKLYNVSSFIKSIHPDCWIREEIRMRMGRSDDLSFSFLERKCKGLNLDIDEIINHGLFMTKITNIFRLEKQAVYDFTTTGDKELIANGFYTRDSVFGIMYGRGAKSLAAEHGMSEEDAERIRTIFFDRYPKAKDWIYNIKKVAQEYGMVVNAFGRIRRLPAAQIPWGNNMDKHDEKDKGDAMRQATNSPIQSMAADITAITAIRIHKRLQQLNSKIRLVLTVHDSLIYEVPKEERNIIVQIIKEEVARGYNTIEGPIRVPMKIDVSVGERWGKLEEIKE